MPKNCQKSGKNMGFDNRGSMPVTCPFTCSKKRNVPTGRFSFWKIACELTRVEGGAASGNERFALRNMDKGLLVRQSRQLIIAERGAPPKARLSSPYKLSDLLQISTLPLP